MSFRKGNLAVFIKCPTVPANIGTVVTLVKRGLGDTKGMWLVEGRIKHGPRAVPMRDEVRNSRAWARREWLSPLDADDASRDETLSWLPVPSTKEPA